MIVVLDVLLYHFEMYFAVHLKKNIYSDASPPSVPL